jgi:hypothetical protein
MVVVPKAKNLTILDWCLWRREPIEVDTGQPVPALGIHVQRRAGLPAETGKGGCA